MAVEQFANSAFSVLASGINSSVTSLTVTTGHGARFPATGDFRLKIDNEIMLVTARSSDTMTVTRAQESTTAASHSAAAAVNHVLTRASLLALFAGPTFTGQAIFAAGSVSAPSIVGADLDTGIYFPAANQMRIGASGAAKLQIDATGTFAPYPAKLGGGTGYSGVGTGVAPNSDFGIYGDDANQFKTMGDFVYVSRSVTAGSDVSALRAYYQQGTGDANGRAAELHAIIGVGTTAYEKLAVEVTVQSNYAGNGRTATKGVSIRNLGGTWGLGTPQRVDTALYMGGDEYGFENGILYEDTAGASYAIIFRVNRLGETRTASQMYSTGVGGTRVGFLNPTSVNTGETWSGIWYDAGTSRMVIEAVTQGVSWRDVWISKNAGTLRVGPSGHTIWAAPKNAVCNSNLTLTTTPTDISNCSVTLDRVGRWKVTGTYALFASGAGDNAQVFTGALALTGGTGSATGGTALKTLLDANWDTLTQTWIVTVTATTVTAKLQGSKNAGSGASFVSASSTTITAIWMGEP